MTTTSLCVKRYLLHSQHIHSRHDIDEFERVLMTLSRINSLFSGALQSHMYQRLRISIIQHLRSDVRLVQTYAIYPVTNVIILFTPKWILSCSLLNIINDTTIPPPIVTTKNDWLQMMFGHYHDHNPMDTKLKNTGDYLPCAIPSEAALVDECNDMDECNDPSCVVPTETPLMDECNDQSHDIIQNTQLRKRARRSDISAYDLNLYDTLQNDN